MRRKPVALPFYTESGSCQNEVRIQLFILCLKCKFYFQFEWWDHQEKEAFLSFCCDMLALLDDLKSEWQAKAVTASCVHHKIKMFVKKL